MNDMPSGMMLKQKALHNHGHQAAKHGHQAAQHGHQAAKHPAALTGLLRLLAWAQAAAISSSPWEGII